MSDYKERREIQLKNWLEGISIHNHTDNECCPDYSCCKPELLQPVKIRKEYIKADEEQRSIMEFDFMLKGIKKEYPKKVIQISFDSNLALKN